MYNQSYCSEELQIVKQFCKDLSCLGTAKFEFTAEKCVGDEECKGIINVIEQIFFFFVTNTLMYFMLLVNSG